MLDKEQSIHDCIDAIAEGPSAVRGIVTNAVRDAAGVMSGFGEPEHAGIKPVCRSGGKERLATVTGLALAYSRLAVVVPVVNAVTEPMRL